MYEGDTSKGELEIGQVSSMIKDVLPVSEIFTNLVEEYKQTKNKMQINLDLFG